MNVGDGILHTQPVLEVNQLSKKFRGQTIVRSVTFTVERGTVFGLIGENGAGKTTTLGMICGLITPTSGTVLFEGMPIRTMRRTVLRKIGALVDEPYFYKYLTGMEHLQYGSRLYGNVPPERIDEVISLLRMESFIYKKVGQYSLGMKKRLAIAQSLVHRPSLLVLDEPTNGLDPGGMVEFRELIRALVSTRELSVIISSHHLGEIEQICDQFGFMQHGVLTLIGNNQTKSADSVMFQIEVDDPLNAMSLLQQQSYIFDLRLDDGGKITFMMERSSYPSLLQVLGKVGIRSLKEKSFDLEQVYMHLTRTGGKS